MTSLEQAKAEGFIIHYGRVTKPDGSRVSVMAKRIGDGFYATREIPLEPRLQKIKSLLSDLSA